MVEQDKLSYRDNLEKYKPDFVVHGDDWKSGFQQPIREEVIEVLQSYGGRLIEFPYSVNETYEELEKRAKAELATPDMRRARLKKLLAIKGTVTALEAHSCLTGLIVVNTKVAENGGVRQFDAMWVSSLCDSTAKGKPDIELVDMTSRFRTIDDICEVTTKPIIFDGDTGGLTEHFIYTVRSLERMGVSMVIIEDKTGLKKNSLFGTEVHQTQAAIPDFCEKIRVGKKAQRTKDFIICAHIESLILERGMDDALERAFAFAEAGADAIMIHSRKKDPSEIFEFIEKFRARDSATPIVVVPTSFNTVTEEEFKERGVNIVIYANLVHIVINNGAHETVGGMPTVVSHTDIVAAANACGYPNAVCVDHFDGLDKALALAKERNALSLIEVKCAIGARPDSADRQRPRSRTKKLSWLFSGNKNSPGSPRTVRWFSLLTAAFKKHSLF